MRNAMRTSASLLIFAILVNTVFLFNHRAGYDAFNQTAGIAMEAAVIAAARRRVSARSAVRTTHREAVNVLLGKDAFVLFELVKKAHRV